MSSCCYDFTTENRTASRSGNPVLRPLDQCNNKINGNTVAGTYEYGTLVKASAAPNTFEPWVLGVDDDADLYGMSVMNKTTTGADPKLEIINTGIVQFKDVFTATGVANDDAGWWSIHVPLAKRNIYVKRQG